jgi:phage-related tail protein
MVRTWVSGGQNSEVVDRLRKEIADLEAERDKLIEANKSKVFQWASSTIRASAIPNGNLTKEVKEVLSEYDSITQTLFDKEVLLSERMDEQAKFDSLG